VRILARPSDYVVTFILMYETFDHTADLGLRIRATDLNTLFEEAGRALFSVIVEQLDTVQPVRCLEIVLPADEIEYLLFDWLKELLFHFDAEHLLLGQFKVVVDDQGLKGQAWGEPLDRARHVLEHEVKAITYHGLKVEKSDTIWLAEVIVDI
jgi:SHS2 domain-containing protein